MKISFNGKLSTTLFLVLLINISYAQIPVEGGEIWYRIIGDGPKEPIICLHGGPGGNSRYFYQISELSKEHSLIIFDQLGSGSSTHHQNTDLLKVEKFVDQVKAIRDTLNLDEFYIIGQSWGSALGLEFYKQYPEGIKGMIFSGPFFSTRIWSEDAKKRVMSLPDSIQSIIKLAEENNDYSTKDFQRANDFYWSKFGRRNEWKKHPLDTIEVLKTSFVYNYMWGPSEFKATGTLKNYDNYSSLKDIDVPVLLIIGEYDEVLEETAKDFENEIPNAKLKTVKNAGHSSMTDNPEEYVRFVKDFLQ